MFARVTKLLLRGYPSEAVLLLTYPQTVRSDVPRVRVVRVMWTEPGKSWVIASARRKEGFSSKSNFIDG